LIAESFRNRSVQELRALGMQLQNEPGLVAVFAAYDGAKVSVVVSAAADARVNANDLIRNLLADINGRGGGDARIAQGGGTANEEQFAGILAKVRVTIRERWSEL
jgi:alanyl-tRNA synthetase